MATPPKVGARNDLNALKDARRHHGFATENTKRAIDEIERMREHVGRPDYGRVTALLGKAAVELAEVTKHLEEMWTLRALAGMTSEDDLAERLAALEAEVAELRVAVKEKQR